MGVAGSFPSFAGRPPGPVMGRDEADRTLARLGAEHEAIETSLLALEEHMRPCGSWRAPPCPV